VSVIVRARNEQRTIERTLSLLRAQTAGPEIIVVDSGSTDGTVEIARRRCDLLIEIPPESFTFGYALNMGARAASAPVHGAISAHCFPDRADWLERSLAHYEREDVAATNGIEALPDGGPVHGPFYQDRKTAVEDPYWGFSNHASTWRASVWERFPFDEAIEACEDKEWARRVLGAGFVIAYDPALTVPLAHRWRSGPVGYYRRMKLETRALGTFANLPSFGLRDCLREWWSDLPEDRHSAFAHRFFNYYRFAALAGKYVGRRQVARSGNR
jgi:rhamnosyltransferase